METRHQTFGRTCFLVGLAILYLLVGTKLYIAWRDSMWPSWPLGDYLPDALVRAVFATSVPSAKAVLVWILSRDLVVVVAAVCLVLWLLDLLGNGGNPGDDHPDAHSR